MSAHEMLDVVTRSGQLTGLQLDKAIIHEQGLWHRDVHVLVTDGKRILEQQRAHDKSIMPGEWDFSAAGHPLADEEPLAAIVRETREELGIDRPASSFARVAPYTGQLAMGKPSARWIHRTVGENYVLYVPGLKLDDITVQEEEVADVRWVGIDQLEQDLKDPRTAKRHASQPLELWKIGLAGVRKAVAAQPNLGKLIRPKPFSL